MKIYKTQAEFDADVVNGVFKIDDDVMFDFNLVTEANINASDILNAVVSGKIPNVKINY